MIITPKHLEYDFEKRDKLEAEKRELIASGAVSEELANQYLDPEISCAPFIEEAGEFCFLCGDKLTLPAIMWAGSNSENRTELRIWFHPRCVKHFSACLNRDADELKFGKTAADKTLKDWKSRYEA